LVSPNVALGEADHSDGGNGRRDKVKATMALTRPCPASHRNMLFANGIGFLTGRRERVRLAATLLTCPPIGGHREVKGRRCSSGRASRRCRERFGKARVIQRKQRRPGRGVQSFRYNAKDASGCRPGRAAIRPWR